MTEAEIGWEVAMLGHILLDRRRRRRLMSLWDSIVRWFVAFAWPQIKVLIERLLLEVFEWLYHQVRQAMDETRRNETEAATRNAERAEEVAATSPNREEADR